MLTTIKHHRPCKEKLLSVSLLQPPVLHCLRQSLLSSIEMSNVTAVLSSAHLCDVLNINGVRVRALSVHEGGCVQRVRYRIV